MDVSRINGSHPFIALWSMAPAEPAGYARFAPRNSAAYFGQLPGPFRPMGNKSTRARFRLMQEEWTEKLRCPICEKTGEVSLSQSNIDVAPSVQAAPDGFKVVKDGRGIPTFHCETCGVEVDP